MTVTLNHRYLMVLYMIMSSMAQQSTMVPNKIPSSKDPSHKSTIQDLTRTISDLQGRVDSWNRAYVIFLITSILVASGTVFSQYKTIKLSRDLSDAQSRLDSEKDRQLRVGLSERDIRIAELRERAEKSEAHLADANVRISESDARVREAEAKVADSGARVKQAEGRIAVQVAKVKEADARIAEAQRGAAEASAKAEGFRRDIAKANESSAKAEARAAEATLELARFKAPRTLSAEQQARVRAAISPFAGTPYELGVTPIPEAINFVIAIDAVLRSAGWANKESAKKDFRFTFTLSSGSKVEQTYLSNVVLAWTRANLGKHEAAINALGEALKAQGIAVSGELLADDEPSPETIHVLVGVKQ